jgi:hypothetical protein
LDKEENPSPASRWAGVLDWLWFLAWAVASSAWCVTAAGQLSATFDEPIYVSTGLESWRSGSNAALMRLGTMPLPVDVQTLPLYLWERGHGVRFDPAADLDRLLPWARAANLTFWWLLLFYARLAGRHLGGPWAGRLAVALLACEPTFLGNAALATTDISIAACVLAFVYHFRTGREAGWFWRVGVPAFWFAAAVLAKASGLVFAPLCMVMVELERLASSGGLTTAESGWRARLWQLWQALRPLRRDGWRIAALGLLGVFVYCGSDWRAQGSFVAWAHSLPDRWYGRGLVWLTEHLRIFSNAGDGLIRQVRHNVRGHGAYLLGRADPRALWYYFPVVLVIKLSLPLLLAPLLLAVMRPRSLVNWACLAAAGLLVFSLTCRVQIGVRFMLPLAALAVVGLTAGAVQACRSEDRGSSEVRRLNWRRRRSFIFDLRSSILDPRFLLGGCVVWTTAAAVSVWPMGLCYVNELWGGTRDGYRHVSDANYDWGQGLKELARWQRRQGLETLDVWYYGTDPGFKRLPLRDVKLHILPVAGPADVVRHVPGRYLAVSTTLLYGAAAPTEAHHRTNAFLHTLRPVARTTTYLIFDLAGSEHHLAKGE